MKAILDNNVTETIYRYAALSETEQMLHPALLELAYQQRWFKLFVPPVYDGPGKTLPEILRLEEAIAAADGSLGWTVTLCSGAGWFAGFLDPELAHELFADPKVCFAGSGEVGGTATEKDGKYIVNGTWRYASGAMHATVFTANCILQDEAGEQLQDESGAPTIVSFVLKREEVNIIPGWSYFGLVATGSHAFEAVNISVPGNRAFRINENIQAPGLGFDYPFLQMAETTLAVNIAGMGQHFISLAAAAFEQRSGLKRYTPDQIQYFYNRLESVKAQMKRTRTEFYEAFDNSWLALLNTSTIPTSILEAVSQRSRALAHYAREACDTLYPYCGLDAARKETTINRVWRDIHTASQHSLLTFSL
ncbi:alkylation response protein AidB-like acyl-CoA dehydrogenase [Chitinophaga terrae (ex Kim and Jung 2007)]|uniref:acyl-CoA dehydrogenase n=1 Tax=Chitinophaga terrae (ex Kim and Jung 2007) TaxID=408074 RepID=UPI0027841156|nr:acyl-CoA dehydrogenase [Chitinophaga terrae (ex Kim and Jung 2007)]MDQ0106182.1 alkylation response protein AidB-like acyl-CoA dehydrogenase [Chitinophaga terrae (ex Kim and Jung 2007)]